MCCSMELQRVRHNRVSELNWMNWTLIWSTESTLLLCAWFSLMTAEVSLARTCFAIPLRSGHYFRHNDIFTTGYPQSESQNNNWLLTLLSSSIIRTLIGSHQQPLLPDLQGFSLRNQVCLIFWSSLSVCHHGLPLASQWWSFHYYLCLALKSCPLWSLWF